MDAITAAERGLRVLDACLFDLDGTLVNSLEDLVISVNYALAQQGLPTHSADEYRYFVGHGVGMLIEDVLPASSRTPEIIAQTRDLFEAHYWDHCLDHTRPYDGINTLLSELGDLRCGVVTNKPDAYAQKIVPALFGKRFEVVIGQREGVPHKPDPATVLIACAEMSVGPSRCVYLGDSGVDMLTARAVDMFAVGVLWGLRSREELLASGAEALIGKPEELVGILETR
ncbi:MAG: HAD family hydrolase [Coriobacteriia bacterium]